jgi:hypothetical protein
MTARGSCCSPARRRPARSSRGCTTGDPRSAHPAGMAEVAAWLNPGPRPVGTAGRPAACRCAAGQGHAAGAGLDAAGRRRYLPQALVLLRTHLAPGVCHRPPVALLGAPDARATIVASPVGARPNGLVARNVGHRPDMYLAVQRSALESHGLGTEDAFTVRHATDVISTLTPGSSNAGWVSPGTTSRAPGRPRRAARAWPTLPGCSVTPLALALRRERSTGHRTATDH